jgi:hypothetical protein
MTWHATSRNLEPERMLAQAPLTSPLSVGADRGGFVLLRTSPLASRSESRVSDGKALADEPTSYQFEIERRAVMAVSD